MVWWFLIINRSVVQKLWLAVFMFKVILRSCINEIRRFYYIFWTTDRFATKLSLMVQHYKPSVLSKELIVVFKVKVTTRVKIFNKCLSVLHFVSHCLAVKLCLLITNNHIKCRQYGHTYTDNNTVTYSISVITRNTTGGTSFARQQNVFFSFYVEPVNFW